MRTVLIDVLLAATVCAAAEGSWDERRQKLGTPDEPFRILVDKVLMLANKWVMEPEHVAEVKAAGFNVVVPRIGGDDNARVERVARMAMDQELCYMPWIRGTHVERRDPKLRVTSATGQYGALASPNSDALWDYWRGPDSVLRPTVPGQLKLSNRYVCLAGPLLKLVGNQPPAFVAPPPGSSAIGIRVQGQYPGEHLQVTFKAPDGAAVFSGNTSDAKDSVTINLRGKTDTDRAPWSLEATRVVEDFLVDLHDGEPRVATHPGRLLVSPKE